MAQYFNGREKKCSWYKEGTEHSGTGKVKRDGRWKGRVEEKIWGEVTLKTFVKSNSETHYFTILLKTYIHTYKEFKWNYPVIGGVGAGNSASFRHQRLSNQKHSSRYGCFFNSCWSMGCQRPLTIIGYCHCSYLSNRTWRYQVCINLDALSLVAISHCIARWQAQYQETGLGRGKVIIGIIQLWTLAALTWQDMPTGAIEAHVLWE